MEEEYHEEQPDSEEETVQESYEEDQDTADAAGRRLAGEPVEEESYEDGQEGTDDDEEAFEDDDEAAGGSEETIEEPEEDEAEEPAEPDILDTVRDLVGSGSLVLGRETTLKQLRRGLLSDVVISANTPEEVRADIEHYARLEGAAVHTVASSNEELGVLCRKPFAVSVLGMKK